MTETTRNRLNWCYHSTDGKHVWVRLGPAGEGAMAECDLCRAHGVQTGDGSIRAVRATNQPPTGHPPSQRVRDTRPVTGAEMCEVISRWLHETRNTVVTPREIWEASPTGELAHVFDLYAEARAAGYRVE